MTMPPASTFHNGGPFGKSWHTDLTDNQPITSHGHIETWKILDSGSLGGQHNLTLTPALPIALTNLNSLRIPFSPKSSGGDAH